MENKFKTNDLSLAAFLLSHEINLLDIVAEGSFRCNFLLSNPTRCEILRKEYLNNGSAPALTLFTKREMLISEIKQRARR